MNSVAAHQRAPVAYPEARAHRYLRITCITSRSGQRAWRTRPTRGGMTHVVHSRGSRQMSASAKFGEVGDCTSGPAGRDRKVLQEGALDYLLAWLSGARPGAGRYGVRRGRRVATR